MAFSLDIALESDRGLMQQLGRHREIDLGAVEMGMAEQVESAGSSRYTSAPWRYHDSSR